MVRYKCIIEYDGTGFAGWQRQKDVSSLQEAFERAIYKFTFETVTVYASGRTDAGVHAYGQVVHFDLTKAMTAEKLMGALNHFLPKNQIVVLHCEIANADFDARLSAIKRQYHYKILNRIAPAAIEKDRVWVVHKKLDIENMRKAAKHLIGLHDFTTFRDSECQALSPIKTIDSIIIEQDRDYIIFEVTAKSFLHHMVRNIVGTLIMVGLGKWQIDDVKLALEKKDRRAGGPTAPAAGLYLSKISY